MNFSRSLLPAATRLRAVCVLSVLCCACSSDDKPASRVAAGALALPAGTGGVVASAGTSSAGTPSAGAAAASGASFGAVLAIFADTTHNCAFCHSTAANGGGLVFNPAVALGSYMALVGVTSPGAVGSKCGGKVYVVPGQPDASLLYDKLANATPSCGARMPMGGTTLGPTELSTVRSWITGGALNN